MLASVKRIEVVHGSPWFAARLSALLTHDGYVVTPVDSIDGIIGTMNRSPPVAVIFHLQPTAEPRAGEIVSALREVRAFGGPVIVLDRVRKAEGATQYLPRDVSPARVAALVRRLVEAAP